MGTSRMCPNCGAGLAEQQSRCHNCGLDVAIGGPESPPQSLPPSLTPTRKLWPFIVAGVGGLALLMLLVVGGLGLFLWSRAPEVTTLASDAGTSAPPLLPTPAPSLSASPAPTATVTATETATVVPPQPTRTVYLPPDGVAATTDFSGLWDGYLQSSKSDYRVKLELVQDPSNWVSGVIVSTRLRDGVSATWDLQGPAEGNRVVLTPGAWLARPDASWERDTVIIVDDGGTLTASFYDPRSPDTPWSRTTLS